MWDQLPVIGGLAGGGGIGVAILWRLYVVLIREQGSELDRLRKKDTEREIEFEKYRKRALEAEEKLATEETVTAGLEGTVANLQAKIERLENP